MRNHLLAYDVDCGPCRRFKEIVDFMDPKERIAFLSLNEADDLGLLERVPRPKRHTSFHLIFSDGGVKSGAEAIPSVIRLFPMGVLFSKGLLAPGGQRMVAGVYSIFSRLHDSGSCPAFSIRSLSSARARWIRAFTVPSGIWSASAISSYDRSCW